MVRQDCCTAALQMQMFSDCARAWHLANEQAQRHWADARAVPAQQWLCPPSQSSQPPTCPPSACQPRPNSPPAPLPVAGLWRPSDKKCQFIMNSQSWASSGGYSCACTLPSGGELNWEANSACASAPRSAALDPPACRYSKYNSDGPWTMGWYSSGTAGGTCYALGLSVGPQGQSYVGINGGLGGNYKTQLLCNRE